MYLCDSFVFLSRMPVLTCLFDLLGKLQASYIFLVPINLPAILPPKLRVKTGAFSVERSGIVLCSAPDSGIYLPATPAVTCWAIGIRLSSYRTQNLVWLSFAI
jgi:hypothetical protein